MSWYSSFALPSRTLLETINGLFSVPFVEETFRKILTPIFDLTGIFDRMTFQLKTIENEAIQFMSQMAQDF